MIPEHNPTTTSVDNNLSLRLWSWPTYLSLAVTVLILGLLLNLIDGPAVWQQLAEANKTLLIIGGLAHYATYFVRGRRWQLCLAHVSSSTSWTTFSMLIFFVNFVDNIVPAKLADVYGAHLAWINTRVRRSAVMGSILFLRMVDAWIVLLMAALASWGLFAATLPHSVLWTLLLGGLLAFGMTGLVVTVVLVKRTLPTWLPNMVRQRLEPLHTGMWPQARQWVPILGLTLLIWALEALWIVSLASAFGIRLSPLEAMFLTTLPLLASAFPLTPSGAGVVEVTLFGCLHLLGVPSLTASSVTVANRLIDYWLHLVLGALMWAFRYFIGLRTWRELPLERWQIRSLPELSIRRENIHGA